MEWTFLNRSGVLWLSAAAVFSAIFFLVPVVRGFVRRKCRERTAGGLTIWTLAGNLNDRWMRLTTLVIGLAAGVVILEPDIRILTSTKWVLVVVLALQLARLIPAMIDWGIGRLIGGGGDGSQKIPGTLAGLRWLVILGAYAVVVLLALQNLGIDVTAMVAGLGIGGVAIALAVQNILGDLFASLTIALDKPFVAGDFIVVGNEMGAVENVGLKTTRVRSLSGEQLVFANSDLLTSRVRNYKRMSERRVVFSFGVVYSTPPDVLEQIPALVRAVIRGAGNLRFDRCHFFRFGDSSLDFETVYFILSPDYNAHMDAQQRVLLSIARAFRERGIDFAFPTRTIYVAGESDGGKGAGATNGTGPLAQAT